MNVILSLYFVATTVAVAKSSAEADDVSLLAQSLSASKHIVQGLGLNDEKETGNKEETSSANQSAKRMLEAGIKRLVQLKSINDDCYNGDDESDDDNVFVASDGETWDGFGYSCSMSGDLVVIGAPYVDGENMDEGAAYLFHLDGTEIKKLTSEEDGEDYDFFGGSVSIDEKVVVGSGNWIGNFVDVFSRQGIYERTIRCDDCYNYFGRDVATLGKLIVMKGRQNSINKLFVFSTEGELLKTLDQGSDGLEQGGGINGVAMSKKFIVSTGSKTVIYNNISPEFPKIAEINQGGRKVAVAGDRIVTGNRGDDDYVTDGEAYLYKTDGTLVTALDRQDASSGSRFGSSVDITDDKVFVGAWGDDDQDYDSGSIFIYSAVTGEFLEKVVAQDGGFNDEFGSCLSVSDSHYVVGASGADDTGAAYLFQSSEE